MNITELVVTASSATSALSLTIRSALRYVHQRDQIKLAEKVLARTGSTDGLSGYTDLCRAQQPVIVKIPRSRPQAAKAKRYQP